MNPLTLTIVLVAVAVVVGPWIGVIVDRAVEGLRPEAHHRCVHCRTELGDATLRPVASWSDRCWSCGRHKGVRYPLVDLGVVATFVVLGLRFGWKPVLLPYLALALALVALSAIDFETHLLPNIIVWPSIFTGLFLIVVFSGELDYVAGINSALVGAAVFGGFIGLAHVAYERGMGRGDVKLAVLLGLFLGWLQPGLIDTTRLVMITIFVALLGGGLAGLAYNTIRRRGKAEIPFGPALVAASLVGIVISPALVSSSGL